MKKNILKTTLFALVTAPLFTACELDQFPSDSIPNEESWQYFSDAQNFERGVLRSLRSISALGWTALDIQADYFQPGKAYGNRNGLIYRWEFNSSEFEGAWSGPYGAITDFNNFLNNCDNIELETEEQKAQMEHFKGEAYFARAYAYTLLAQFFCKDYEPASADTDLGVPLVKEVDINAKPARATLAETYAFINSDLDQAETLLADVTIPGTDVSIQAVRALRARVYLQMENYDEAIRYATMLVEDDGLALCSPDNFAGLWSEDLGDEIIYMPPLLPSEQMTWGGYSGYSATKNQYTPDWIPSKATIDLYEDGDIRKDVFFIIPMEDDGTESKIVENESEATGVYLFNKYPGNEALLTTSQDVKTTKANAPKTLRLSEQYLILAEAYKRKGDDANAQKYLNDLRQNRGLRPTASIGDVLFLDIKDEWRREFIGEGQRLLCLKRWHEGFSRDPECQKADIIVTSDPEKGIALGVTADNMRFLWEIAANDLTTNPNIIPNWEK